MCDIWYVNIHIWLYIHIYIINIIYIPGKPKVCKILVISGKTVYFKQLPFFNVMVLKLPFLDFHHISSYITRLDPGHLPISTGEPQWAQSGPNFWKGRPEEVQPPLCFFQLENLRYVLHIWNLTGLCSSFVTQTALVVAAMASIIAKCSIESASKIKDEGWGFDHQKIKKL